MHRAGNKIRQSLKKGNTVPLYFPDIQADFKRVWHKGLLYKIQAFLLLLMESYLTCRFFQVREDGALSIIQDIMAKVPQGSVLGPVLYTIYIADLPQTEEKRERNRRLHLLTTLQFSQAVRIHSQYLPSCKITLMRATNRSIRIILEYSILDS